MLASVPGLTPQLARRIIAHRPFNKMKELLHVRGVEPDIYETAIPHLKLANGRKKPKTPEAPPQVVAEPVAAVARPLPPPAMLVEYVIESTPASEPPPSSSVEIIIPLIQTTIVAAPPVPSESPPPLATETPIEIALEATAPAETVESAPTESETATIEDKASVAEAAPQPESSVPAEMVESTEEAPTAITEDVGEHLTLDESPAPAEPILESPPPRTTADSGWATRESVPPRAPRAAPVRETIVREFIYDPEVVVIDPGPPPMAETHLVRAPVRALAATPAQKIADVLFDSYLGPRVMFSFFTAVLALALLAIAAGVIHFDNPSPQATLPPPTPMPVGMTVITAAPTVTSPPAATAPVIVAPTAAAPTATSIFVSNSGLVGAGAQIFNETFDSPGYWDLGESDFSLIQIAERRLSIAMKRAGAISWTLNGYAGGDFFYQATATVGACHASDYFGLAFRSQSNGYRYLFGLSCGGQYRVMRQRGAEYDTLIDFTFTPKAATGSGSINLLAVRAEGAAVTVYVNDQFLATVEGVDPAPGLFGLFVRSTDTPNLKVEFDDLAAWQLNP